ncbi:MAG: hypothetical protein AB8H79_00250 [Myxococcota bacterium]
MTSRLSHSFADETRSHASLSGIISEDADFSEIIAAAQAHPLTLRLGDIQRISSTGVREWILFMRAVADAPHAVTLTEVAPTLVRQLNMIDGFGGSAVIASVVLPYYCDACGKEHAQVLAVGPDDPRDIDAHRPCPHCGEQAEFDDLPSSYLAFLGAP